MLLEDAVDLADMLEHLGRVVPAAEWVDEIRAEIDEASFEGLL